MNSTAHDNCEKWIISKFKSYGLEVKTQKADLKGIDGEVFHSTNIIASYNPKAATRILVSAHWDSRPWADNDPDSTKHNEPVMAANDGASGVAVMLELARVLSADKKLSKDIGVDFVCFDAEDCQISLAVLCNKDGFAILVAEGRYLIIIVAEVRTGFDGGHNVHLLKKITKLYTNFFIYSSWKGFQMF